MKSITVEELNNKTQPYFLLDVREPDEFTFCAIEGSVNIPLRKLPAEFESLPKDCEIITICHHGMRSLRAQGFLALQGFENVINLKGGVAAWAEKIDPSMPTY